MKKPLRVEEVLGNKGIYVSTTVGTSMYPMLRNRRDTVIIRPITGRLKKYDVPLYKRGDDYILHRIVKVTANGYVICGDNCLNREFNITDEQIVGVLRGVYRDDKEVNMDGIRYRLYCRLWVALYPLRYILKRMWLNVKMMVKKVLR